MSNSSAPVRAVTYARVSTAEQAESGLSVAAQQSRTASAVHARGWRLVSAFADEGVSGAVPPGERQQLSGALGLLAGKRADALVVSQLDRLGRSAVDLLEVLGRSVTENWSLVLLDVPLDTTSAFGECCLTILAAVAQLERRLIGERTKASLAVSRSQGTRLGRPCRQSPEARRICVDARRAGHTLSAIARMLTERSLLTATGKSTWHPSTVASILKSERLDREADEARRLHAAAA